MDDGVRVGDKVTPRHGDLIGHVFEVVKVDVINGTCLVVDLLHFQIQELRVVAHKDNEET